MPLCDSKSAWELVFLHNSSRCSFFSRHPSHLCIFGLDLPVACFPRAREPGFTPSNRRAPQVCRKAPKIDLGRPPAVDLSVAPTSERAVSANIWCAAANRRLRLGAPSWRTMPSSWSRSTSSPCPPSGSRSFTYFWCWHMTGLASCTSM